MTVPLLEAEGVTKRFGTFTAVDGVSLSILPGETLAIVGESGSGKTTLARCLGLLQSPDNGRMRFRGVEMSGLSGAALRAVRADIQMVFQDPFSSLNPRLRIGAILAEPFLVHGIGTRRDRPERVAELLRAVGLSPEDMRRYPHEFSGGQRQRIAIARAIALDPAMVIADEPVSALDVSIQSQILNLLMDLQQSRGLAMLFISHDLAVVSEIADRVAVMRGGRLIETGPVGQVFSHPADPYTAALIEAVPSL